MASNSRSEGLTQQLADELLVYAKVWKSHEEIDPARVPNLWALRILEGEGEQRLISLDALLRKAIEGLSNSESEDDSTKYNKLDRWCAAVLLQCDPNTYGSSFNKRREVIEDRLGISEKAYFGADSRGPRLLRDVATEILRLEYTLPEAASEIASESDDDSQGRVARHADDDFSEPASPPSSEPGATRSLITSSTPVDDPVNGFDEKPASEENQPPRAKNRRYRVALIVSAVALVVTATFVRSPLVDEEPLATERTRTAVLGSEFNSGGIEFLVAEPWIATQLGQTPKSSDDTDAHFLMFPVRLENREGGVMEVSSGDFSLSAGGKRYTPERGSRRTVPNAVRKELLQPDQVVRRVVMFRVPRLEIPFVYLTIGFDDSHGTRHPFDLLATVGSPPMFSGTFSGGHAGNGTRLSARIEARRTDSTRSISVDSVRADIDALGYRCRFRFSNNLIAKPDPSDSAAFSVKAPGLSMTGRFQTSVHVTGKVRMRQVMPDGRICRTSKPVDYAIGLWPTSGQFVEPLK